MPTQTLKNISPCTILFGQTPHYDKLRVFGCQCFPWLRPYSPNKLVPRSRPCIFLGYSLSQSAYRCLDPASNCIFISRHVQFDESTFPFSSHELNAPRVSSDSLTTWSSSISPVTFVPIFHATTPHQDALTPTPAHANPQVTLSSTSEETRSPLPSVSSQPTSPSPPPSSPQPTPLQHSPSPNQHPISPTLPLILHYNRKTLTP